MSAPPSTSALVRRLTFILVAGALLAGLVVVPRNVASLSVAHTDNGWSTAAVARTATVARGSTISFQVTASSDRPRRGLVDLELNDDVGTRVFQSFWDRQVFSAKVPRTYTATWKVPDDARLGTYFVRLGVFRVGWGKLYHWNHVAATFKVVAATPTPTTTIPAPTTLPRATTTTVAPTTTPPTSAPGTTTTTAPPTTVTPTTAPPTTAPPTTVTPPTTTLPPTSPPAPGTRFTETFDSADGFYGRFDRGLSGAHPTVDPNHIREWSGDHDHSCGDPSTSRTVHLGQDRQHIEEMFWHCAPGGDPAKGHVMTSLTVLGYNILWFSPRGYFDNVSQVCWDQNLTNMGGRKWTQVVLAGRSDVERVGGDLGFTHPGFQQDGGPTTGIHPSDATVGINVTVGSMQLWRGGQDLGGSGSDLFKPEDKATRYRHCATDNGNGTVTLTQQRPDGLRSWTVGGSFPDGQVRVVFADANYDPPKDGDYDGSQNTWHWDNITIS